MFNALTKSFCKQLKIKRPIIQAPMAGSIVTPELVYEVSKAGGLGSLPLGYLSLKDAKELIQKTTQLTPHYAVNIFIPTPISHPPAVNRQNMLSHINRYRQQLQLEPLKDIPIKKEASVDELIDLVINSSIPILSFVFGILDEPNIHRLKQNNIYLIGTATTVTEGLALEQAGCDAVIAQGYEAGGHRGGFLNAQEDDLIGTMSLIPLMVDALKIPIIAAGGIMDGRGTAASLMLGASAVQMGTAFLTCKESNASQLHKQLLLQKSAEDTYLTKTFTGKSVRCLKNRFVAETEHLFNSEAILPYPLQHQLTQELRSAAKAQDNFNYSGFWSGQAISLARELSAHQLMAVLEEETQRALNLRS